MIQILLIQIRYWEDYGFDIFTYSYYEDKYRHTNNDKDKKKADEALAKVPPTAIKVYNIVKISESI